MKTALRNWIYGIFCVVMLLAFLEYKYVTVFHSLTETKEHLRASAHTYSESYKVTEVRTELASKTTNEQPTKNNEETRQPRLGNTYSDAYNVSQNLTEFAPRMTNEQPMKNMEETRQPRLGNTYSDAYKVSQDLTEFAPRMTNEQAMKTLELIKVMVKQLEKYNVSYFAYYGALLGISRHMGFIPWDDDFDISVDQSQAALLIEALSEVNETHTLLTDRKQSWDIWKFYKNDGAKLGPVVFLYPFIDIIFRHEKQNMYFESELFHDFWRRDDTFPLLKRLHNDVEVYTPCGMDNILKMIFKNTETCVSTHFSHINLKTFKPKSVPCVVLKDFYPFTERQYEKGNETTKVIERLSFKNESLKTVQYFVPNVCTDKFSYFDSKIQIL